MNHILFETPRGIQLYKLLDEKYLNDPKTLSTVIAEKIPQVLQFVAFKNYKSGDKSIQASVELAKGKLPKTVKKFLKTHLVKPGIKTKLAVGEKELSNSITDALGIQTYCNELSQELTRAIRQNFTTLSTGVSSSDLAKLSRGLAFQYSRFQLQVSVDKIDSMIIRSSTILDDVDKQLNNYSMRLREWYSWHFPDLDRMIPDNTVYSKLCVKIGLSDNASNVDLSDLVDDEVAEKIKKSAILTLGSKITQKDVEHIQNLAQSVLQLTDTRNRLINYLENRMSVICPNFTHILSARIGAKLIAKAGSLRQIAKNPASTVQMYGAEKALFHAMKTGQPTPKYGVLYHTSVVGKAPPKLKGPVTRLLATKSAICARYDYFAEDPQLSLGREHKETVEKRLESLRSREMQRTTKFVKRFDDSSRRPYSSSSSSKFNSQRGGYESARQKRPDFNGKGSDRKRTRT